jgi:uncharacterized membrane protein
MKVKLTPNQSVPAASAKLAIAGGFGLAAGLVTAIAWWKLAPLVAWDVAALVYIASTWQRVLKFDAGLVKKHALREDPSRVAADIVLLGAAVASLGAVALVLVSSHQSAGLPQLGKALLAVLSVVISWVVVHTVYALRYAELYYTAPEGGVDFDDTKTPIYADFAYLAFTLGMTYQVSDTTLGNRRFRSAALGHALLSYLFGTVIVAATINLIVGLGR